jgi:prepilin-type processing-associated H-X9-DG protein
MNSPRPLLRWSLALFVLTAVSLFTGCARDSHTADRREDMNKLMQAKQGALICIMYADDHGQQYPPDFAAAAAYAKGDFVNELAANFDLVYAGAATNIAKPAETIILREKTARQHGAGKWLKTYAFADGHAEIHAAPDGNFADWEKERIIKQ